MLSIEKHETKGLVFKNRGSFTQEQYYTFLSQQLPNTELILFKDWKQQEKSCFLCTDCLKLMQLTVPGFCFI